MPQVDLYELKRGDGPPLIGVHGSGGILFLGRLAAQIGAAQPFYALHGRGLDRLDREPEFTDVRQLAAAYADAAAGRAAKGPVFVCGRWGPIVLETGHALQARDVKVAALIVLDGKPGAVPGTHGQPMPEPASRWRVLARTLRTGGLRTQLRPWLKPRKRRTRNPFGLRNHQLIEEYEPRKFHGRIVLILSEEYAGNPRKLQRAAAWSLLCGELQVHVTPGGHKQLCLPPYVAPLGTLVQDILDNTAIHRDTA